MEVLSVFLNGKQFLKRGKTHVRVNSVRSRSTFRSNRVGLREFKSKSSSPFNYVGRIERIKLDKEKNDNVSDQSVAGVCDMQRKQFPEIKTKGRLDLIRQPATGQVPVRDFYQSTRGSLRLLFPLCFLQQRFLLRRVLRTAICILRSTA